MSALGLFAPAAEAVVEYWKGPGFCGCCNHPLKSHCKVGTSHTTYKDQARMVKGAEVSFCPCSHCLEPLCCCTTYAESPDDVRAPQTPLIAA